MYTEKLDKMPTYNCLVRQVIPAYKTVLLAHNISIFSPMKSFINANLISLKVNSCVSLQTITNFISKHHFCISKKGQKYIGILNYTKLSSIYYESQKVPSLRSLCCHSNLYILPLAPNTYTFSWGSQYTFIS